MRNNDKLEKALALIITCTRRIKRAKDIVTLARNIAYAAKRLGSVEAVGEAVSLSVQQLKDFLAVENLCLQVKALVAKRVIDSVDVVKTIRSLSPERQKGLAKSIAEGRVSSKDVRVIATFAKKFPNVPITKVIRDYEKSKDIKVYVAEIALPVRFQECAKLRARFEEIVGKAEIRSFRFKRNVVVLEVSSLGHKRLRDAVRKRRTTLRRFVASLVDEVGR